MAESHSINNCPDHEHFDPDKQMHIVGWERQPAMIPRTLAFEPELSIIERMVGVYVHTIVDNRSYGGSFYDWISNDEVNASVLGISVDEYRETIFKLHDLGYLTIKGRALPATPTVREKSENALARGGLDAYYAQCLHDREKATQSLVGIRKQISPNMRLAVYEHDGYRCVACGSSASLTVDHIVPVVHGGTNEQDNLQTLCKSCNSAKGTKSMSEWKGTNK